jgi:hypothetical protein
MIRLGIIGTAGRNPNQLKKLSTYHMQWINDTIKSYIEFVIEKNPNEIILVSGGSAWVDHVAIQLYLEGNFGGLELYLPTNFDKKIKKFEPTYEGNILNLLHSACAEKIGHSVFDDLYEVVTDPNVKIIIKKGFFQRNTLISQNNDHLIAFTFDKIAPSNGGTHDTWSKTKHNNKIHFSLTYI